MKHRKTQEQKRVAAPVRLERQLGLRDVYALATGATLSSGFFLLPGLAAAGAGSAMPLSYLLGAVILVPGLLSMGELTTALPRAGGIYYFLDRSMGPLMGAIGGFGTWVSLILKSGLRSLLLVRTCGFLRRTSIWPLSLLLLRFASGWSMSSERRRVEGFKFCYCAGF